MIPTKILMAHNESRSLVSIYPIFITSRCTDIHKIYKFISSPRLFRLLQSLFSNDANNFNRHKGSGTYFFNFNGYFHARYENLKSNAIFERRRSRIS